MPTAWAAADRLPRRSISTSRRIRVVSQSPESSVIPIVSDDTWYCRFRLARSKWRSYGLRMTEIRESILNVRSALSSKPDAGTLVAQARAWS